MQKKRLLPLAGIVFVALFLVAMVLNNPSPDGDASGGKLFTYYDEHTGREMAAAFLLAASTPFLVIFGAALTTSRRPDEPRSPWEFVLLAGTTLAAGALQLLAFVHFALADAPGQDLSGDAIRVLAMLDGHIIATTGLGVMMLGAAGTLLARSGGLRRLAWPALVFGIALFAPGPDFFAFLLSGVWIIVVGIALARGATHPTASAARQAAAGIAVVSVILGLAVLSAGCGGSDGGSEDKGTAVAAGGFSSPYCVTARKWAVHELNGGGDGAAARGGPPALKKWWNEQLAYLKTALEQVPPAVRDAEAKNERFIRTRLTPLARKYGFDGRRVEAEASPSEKALFDHPPPDLAKAQETRNTYQNRVCGYGGQPPAAHVTFRASAAAKPYCEAVAKQRKDLDEIASSGFDPEASRSYATSGRLTRALDEQDRKAPAEIAVDVKADNEWARTRQLEVWKRFDYNLRRILLEGSAKDLAAFTYWDPAIREQGSRVTAYQEQVCGG